MWDRSLWEGGNWSSKHISCFYMEWDRYWVGTRLHVFVINTINDETTVLGMEKDSLFFSFSGKDAAHCSRH